MEAGAPPWGREAMRMSSGPCCGDWLLGLRKEQDTAREGQGTEAEMSRHRFDPGSLEVLGDVSGVIYYQG